MPRTNVVFYQEKSGEAPVLEWLGELRRTNRRAYETCVASVERLAIFGHELRRPLSDLLRDGIHELRIRKGAGELPDSVFLSRARPGDSGTRNHQNGCRAGRGDREMRSPQAGVRIGPGRKILFGGRRFLMAKTKDALKILERVTGGNPAVRRGITNAHVNLDVAQMIYDARTRAGMSQRQLAELVGSQQSVIARLEDADYEGHSLTMLQRIGSALGQRLELRYISANRRGLRRARGLSISNRLQRRA